MRACARGRNGSRFSVARLHMETRAEPHKLESALEASLRPRECSAGEYETRLPHQGLKEA